MVAAEQLGQLLVEVEDGVGVAVLSRHCISPQLLHEEHLVGKLRRHTCNTRAIKKVNIADFEEYRLVCLDEFWRVTVQCRLNFYEFYFVFPRTTIKLNLTKESGGDLTYPNPIYYVEQKYLWSNNWVWPLLLCHLSRLNVWVLPCINYSNLAKYILLLLVVSFLLSYCFFSLISIVF